MKAFRHIALLTLSHFLLMGCGNDDKPEEEAIIQPAKVIIIGEKEANFTKEFPGTVRASQRVDLAFQVQGRLVELPIKEGQPVTKGTLLAKLDDRDHKSMIKATRAEVVKNKSNFKRAKELIVKKFISQVDFDRIEAQVDISVSRLERAEKALDDSQIIAPFTGVVARRYVENFQDVQAKQPILSLQDKAQLEVVINVSETLMARQEETKDISMVAIFDALPNQSFSLYIKEFSTEADPQTQTFEYILGIKDTGSANILPGMTAKVKATIDINSKTGKIVIVPFSALVAGVNNTASVWSVDNNNQVSLQSVTTGELIGRDQVQVTSGLNNGDIVVVAGITALTQGMTIKPISEVRY